jgi:hypothetical protein
VLYNATLMRKQAVDKLRERGWSLEDAVDMVPSHFHFVHEMAKWYTSSTQYVGQQTPIESIQGVWSEDSVHDECRRGS